MNLNIAHFLAQLSPTYVQHKSLRKEPAAKGLIEPERLHLIVSIRNNVRTPVKMDMGMENRIHFCETSWNFPMIICYRCSYEHPVYLRRKCIPLINIGMENHT